MAAEEVRKLNVEYTQDSHHILKKGHLDTSLSSNPACWSLSQSLQLVLVPGGDSDEPFGPWTNREVVHSAADREGLLKLLLTWFINNFPQTVCFFGGCTAYVHLGRRLLQQREQLLQQSFRLTPTSPCFLPLSVIPSPTPAIFILVKISAVN